MSSTVFFGKVRTAIDEVLGAAGLRRDREEASRIWESVRPKLTLSMEVTPSNRMARFKRNILAAHLPRPVRYLEIGAFEGGSLAFVHAVLGGRMTATAIDPFLDYDDLPGCGMGSAMSRFQMNVAAIGAEVRLLRGASVDRLPDLVRGGETFDLIFIDGSHHALDVMTDAVLSWRLLAPGGLMIFDDYGYRVQKNGRLIDCTSGIDGFIKAMASEVKVVDIAGQAFLRRLPLKS